MFDIGFSEVLLIFVIALVVLGPEKLPRLASQVGRWIGRARAMARQFREQLEEEVNLEEVRKSREQKPKTTTADAVSSQEATPSSGAAHGEPSSGADHAIAQGHDTQQTQHGATDASGSGGYGGPDPADFRADTFSHAHPTNEYGANPYTSTGAAEEPAPTASEANVAAAQPEPEAVTEQHAAPDEGYPHRRPRDNTPGTDNHGN